jgi:hypothetical protein
MTARAQALITEARGKAITVLQRQKAINDLKLRIFF